MRVLRPAIVVIVFVALCGCSFAYMEEDGSRRVFGFGDTTEGQPRDSRMFVSAPREFETLGLSVMSLPDGYGVALGWFRLREGELVNRAGPAGTPEEPPNSGWRFGPFFAMAVRAPSPATSAGTVTSVETVGLALVKLGPETELKLGYGHDTVVGLGDNVLVRGNPVREIEASFGDDEPEGGPE